MYTFFHSSFIFILTVILLLLATPFFIVHASDVLVVDTQNILERSKVWKKITKDTRNYASKLRSTVLERQKAIETIWKNIRKMREDKKKAKDILLFEKKFQKQSAELQEYTQIEKRKMENAFLTAKKQVKDKIEEIVKRIAKKRRAKLVLNETKYDKDREILYFDKNISIIEEVLKILNVEMPTVTMNISSGS